MKHFEKSAEDALIGLYFAVKVRKQEDLESLSQEQLFQERENLKNLKPDTIVEYIKNSIDILVELKVEERLEEKIKETAREEESNDYEPLLIKLESDVRQHIRLEHQMKLHTETLQSRIEELETENGDLNKKIKQVNESFSVIKKRESEIASLKLEIHNQKQVIKSYEDQSVKLSDLEKKMKNMNSKHEKEIRVIEEKYRDKLKGMNRKLRYEDNPRLSNSFINVKIEEEEEKLILNNELESNSNKNITNSRKSPVPSDRKQEPDSVKDRIDQYKKLLDRNTNAHAINKLVNRSGILEALERNSNINSSLLTKDKTIDLNNSKSQRKNDSLIQNLEKATKNVLAKDNYKTHNRHSSMEIKSSDKISIGNLKNIQAMKEVLLLNHNKPTKITKPNNRQNSINSSIILNQGGNPCINQITIYTTNNPNNAKNSDINLRNILNKANNKKLLSKYVPTTNKSSKDI